MEAGEVGDDKMRVEDVLELGVPDQYPNYTEDDDIVGELGDQLQ